MSSTRLEWYQFRNLLQIGDFGTASSMLALKPGLIAERNSIGESVLHYLGVENCQEAVEWLYQRGSDLNSADDFGQPLLFDVALLGYRDLFVWLIAHGADPKRKGSGGQTIEEYLSEMDKDEMIEFVRQQSTP